VPLVDTLSVELADSLAWSSRTAGSRIALDLLGNPLTESEIMPEYPSRLVSVTV
jgi:hypothetical protein